MKQVALAVVVVGAVMGGCLFGSSRAFAQAAPCYMAFIHGSGQNFHDEDPRSSTALEHYWAKDGAVFNSFVYYAARQWAGEAGCRIWRVGYDGNQSWWSERAAGRVA